MDWINGENSQWHTKILRVSYCCVMCFVEVVFCNVDRDINHYCNVTIATIDQPRFEVLETIKTQEFRNNRLKIFDVVGGAGRGGEVDIRVGRGWAESDAGRDKIVPRPHPLLAPGYPLLIGQTGPILVPDWRRVQS